ncbi:MAG: ImmA/IrrE family metallo-endopeptidase [Candidatus Saccharicenans sp.]|nr:ImmA/IrrE family metallo-endopeptidase [Candidatus Saccharicenans sp.]
MNVIWIFSAPLLIQLSKDFNVSLQFFLRPSLVTLTAPANRCHTTRLSKQALINIKAHVQEWLERYITIEKLSGEEQKFTRPGIDRRITKIEEVEIVAIELRKYWKLGLDAIRNLSEILESFGLKVGFVQEDKPFDGLCLTANETIPVIVIQEKISGDRQRLSLAHELAHLILEFPRNWKNKDIERTAFRFAGAFLVPEPMVIKELGAKRHFLDIDELHFLKHKYGMSMQAWVRRAYDLEIISKAAAVNLYREFRKRGWHLSEPGESYPDESSSRLERLTLRALREGVINSERARELLGKPLPQLASQL